MKRALLFFSIILMAVCLFSCFDVPESKNITTEHILTIEAPEALFDAVQGATFDGEHYYVAFVNKYLPNETAIIVKTDANGSELKRSEVLPLDHANSITILESGDLMVAHCQSPDGHYYRYSIIDKDTFEVKETKDLNEPFMSIAYCKSKRCFVSGEWNGDKMNVYGADLSHLYSFNVKYIENSFPQSYFCYGDEIYAVRCTNDGSFHNYLYAYSYEGEILLEYEMDLPRLSEAEAVSIINGEAYIICGEYGKCEIYKITNLIQGE